MTKPQWADPDLQTLVDLFYADPSEMGSFAQIIPSEMPDEYRQLLAHSSHMTVTLEEFHGSNVDVHVIDRQKTSAHYSRKILLSRQSDSVRVQLGIVRLNSGFLNEKVRTEIESEDTPLGRILINHNVMRTVKLLSLWKIEPGQDLKELLDLSDNKPIYGRTALIYCDGVPAVELLEIVCV